MLLFQKVLSKDDVLKTGGNSGGKVDPIPAITPPGESKPAPVESGEFVVAPKGALSRLTDEKKATSSEGVGVVPLGMMGAMVMTFGGTDNIMTDDSGSSRPGDSSRRRGSRFEKKQDKLANSLNDVAPRLFDVPVKGPKRLHESAGSVQGTRGRQSNSNLVRQKGTGIHTADPNFARSIDYITKDKLYFSSGQMISSDQVYPGRISGHYDNFAPTVDKANHLNRSLQVVFDEDANIIGFEFISDWLGSFLPDEALSLGAQHAILEPNQAELDRLAIEEKASNEAADFWSPLGTAIPYSNEILLLMKDMLTTTGSEVYAAARKGGQAFSFFLNKSALDGQKLYRPVIEAFTSPLVDSVTSDAYEHDDGLFAGTVQGLLSNINLNSNGSAGLLIAMNDSLTKYRNKADLLLLPRSLKMNYLTNLNLIDKFYVKPEFAKIVSKMETFSTIDGKYDPTRPVHITDRMNIIHPIDYNDFFTLVDGRLTAPHSYQFDDMRNTYSRTLRHPLVFGLFEWIRKNSHLILGAENRRNLVENTTLGVANGTYTWNIPIGHMTTGFSLWSYLITSALPEILKVQVETITDVLAYEQHVGVFPISGIKTIADFSPYQSDNYTYSDIDSVLKLGAMNEQAKINWFMPELFTANAEFAGDSWAIEAPWYFSEEMFDVGLHVRLRTQDGIAMNYFGRRPGLATPMVDFITNIDERLLRLSIDRLVNFPGVRMIDGDILDNVAQADFFVKKHSTLTDGIPVIRKAQADFTVGHLLSTPRELGFSMDAPAGLFTYNGEHCDDTSIFPNFDATTGGIEVNRTVKGMDSAFAFEMSYKLYSYMIEAVDIANIGVAPNLANGMGANFTQKWYAYRHAQGFWNGQGGIYASPAPSAIGLWFSAAQLFVRNGDDIVLRANEGQSSYIFSSTGVRDLDPNFTKVDYAKYLHTYINVLDFMINPFDAITPINTLGDDESSAVDIYEPAYLFGLIDGYASDFTEDIYNRIDKKDKEQYQYTEDLFVQDSPLFR